MNDRIEGAKWIAFALLFVGMILKWIHIDENGILFNLGFIAFGVISLIDAIKAKYYKQFTIDMLRVILPIVIIVTATVNIFQHSNSYIVTLLAVVLLGGLAQRRALFAARKE